MPALVSGLFGRGHHRPITFSGLFLPSIESDAAMSGMSLGAMLKEAGGESFWKTVQSSDSWRDPDAPLSKAVERFLRRTMRDMPDTLLKRQLEQALASGRNRVEHDWPGDWSVSLAARGDEISPARRCTLLHYVEIEQAVLPAVRAADAGDFAGAADRVAASPSLRHYLNDDALARLRGATRLPDATASRLAGLFEVLVAHIARAEVASCEARTGSRPAGARHLLAGGPHDVTQPGRSLVEGVMHLLGQPTRSALSALDRRDEGAIDETTLGRWARGRQFPTNDVFQRFLDQAFQACLGNVDSAEARRMRLQADFLHWTALRLQALLRMLRFRAEPGWILRDMAPLDWLQERHAFWRDAWMAQPLPPFQAR